MKKRKGMSKKHSKKVFRKTSGIHIMNKSSARGHVNRGGIRL